MKSDGPISIGEKKVASWFSALKQSWRGALQFDRLKITAFQAIRSTISFVIPLALGVATGYVEAYLLDNPSRHALPEIATFSSKVDEALGLLVTAIRKRQPVKELPNLQEALYILEHSVKSGKHAKDGSSSADLRFFISEAKRIIESINTMNELLCTISEKPAPGY